MLNRAMRRALARQKPRSDAPRGGVPRVGNHFHGNQSGSCRTAGSVGQVQAYNSVNTRGMPAHLVELIARTSAEYIAKYGEDSATLQQAAAHEAGHLIVAVALGGRPQRARVFSQSIPGRKIWVGENEIQWRWAADDYPFEFATDIPRAITEMAQTLGGIAGEGAVGLDHPSSSVDERCIASMGIGGLARLLNMSNDETASMIETVAKLSIVVNRLAFDELRDLLQREHHVDRLTIERVLQRCEARQVFDAAVLARLGEKEAL